MVTTVARMRQKLYGKKRVILSDDRGKPHRTIARIESFPLSHLPEREGDFPGDRMLNLESELSRMEQDYESY